MKIYNDFSELPASQVKQGPQNPESRYDWQAVANLAPNPLTQQKTTISLWLCVAVGGTMKGGLA